MAIEQCETDCKGISECLLLQWTAELNAAITQRFFAWLVGPLEVQEAEIEYKGEKKTWKSGVQIKKCRYLEQSGCKGMCINMCKVRLHTGCLHRWIHQSMHQLTNQVVKCRQLQRHISTFGQVDKQWYVSNVLLRRAVLLRHALLHATLPDHLRYVRRIISSCTAYHKCVRYMCVLQTPDADHFILFQCLSVQFKPCTVEAMHSVRIKQQKLYRFWFKGIDKHMS